MVDHVAASRLKRSALAARTGCNLETIRYYETIGLLPEPERSPAGYRLYAEADVLHLRFIMRARELGFSVADIQGLLALVEGGGRTCAEVKALTERHLADVRAKIADLQRIEHVLSTTAARCAGDTAPDCPIVEALRH